MMDGEVLDCQPCSLVKTGAEKLQVDKEQNHGVMVVEDTQKYIEYIVDSGTEEVYDNNNFSS